MGVKRTWFGALEFVQYRRTSSEGGHGLLVSIHGFIIM